jgi:hypothetical protein
MSTFRRIALACLTTWVAGAQLFSLMDAALGVSGYTILNFESTALLPGFSIDLTDGVPATTSTSLPNLFDQTVSGSLTDNSVWDGSHGTINTTTNTLSNCNNPANLSLRMTLNFGPGATSVGVGFGNFQSLSSPAFPITNHELFVNGVDQGVLETLAGAAWTAGLARNAYLRIDGTGGTTISSVAIQNLVATDFLVIDHVAIQAEATPEVPEPSTYGFTLAGGAGSDRIGPVERRATTTARLSKAALHLHLLLGLGLLQCSCTDASAGS